MTSLPWLRRQAVSWSLARNASLAETMDRLGFVQADPIRAPAPAQELILRHRVSGYRVGDLDQAYPKLPLEEDYVYAYGFVTRPLRRFLHPRPTDDGDGPYQPRGLAAEVLAFVRERGVTHPRSLWEAFGRTRVVNGWGGQSAATTRVLEELHYYGLVRVARRENGVRLYEPAPPLDDPLDVSERAREVALLIARILAPVPEASLRAALPRRLSRAAGGRGAVVRGLLATGALAATEVDGVRYLWPADLAPAEGEPEERVRLLAPFDPVVWDRRRFEHLWGWAYRFEAYTPPAKRRLGYYALPLLWRDRVIGWANCARDSEGRLTVETGYVDGPPKARRFAVALDAEIARLATFLTPRGGRTVGRLPALRAGSAATPTPVR
jgi:hypothetical protein